MGSFIYISGEVETVKPLELTETEIMIKVIFLNKRAVVKMPIRLESSLATAYKNKIKDIGETETIHIEIFGNLFITKDNIVYVDAFNFNIANATKLYETIVKRAMPKTQYIRRKGKRKWKKS